MLQFKQQPKQTITETSVVTSDIVFQPTLLAEKTNDELLEELRILAKSHVGARKAVLGSYLTGIALFFVSFVLATIARSANNLSLLQYSLWLAGSVAFVPLGLYGALRIGRSFFKRKKEALETIVSALAQRGEARSLAILLDLLDMRVGGNLMWQECRPILLGSMESALTEISEDQLQEMSQSKMWDIAMMLYFPDGDLRDVASAALVRCGDKRTLDALLYLQRIGIIGATNPKSRTYSMNPAMQYLKSAGVPQQTPEVNAAVDRTVAELSAKLDGYNRTAQLLRASTRDSSTDATALVRAAASPGLAIPSDELLRPVADDEGKE